MQKGQKKTSSKVQQSNCVSCKMAQICNSQLDQANQAQLPLRLPTIGAQPFQGHLLPNPNYERRFPRSNGYQSYHAKVQAPVCNSPTTSPQLSKNEHPRSIYRIVSVPNMILNLAGIDDRAAKQSGHILRYLLQKTSRYSIAEPAFITRQYITSFAGFIIITGFLGSAPLSGCFISGDNISS